MVGYLGFGIYGMECPWNCIILLKQTKNKNKQKHKRERGPSPALLFMQQVKQHQQHGQAHVGACGVYDLRVSSCPRVTLGPTRCGVYMCGNRRGGDILRLMANVKHTRPQMAINTRVM